jgi:octaprenyl-diphosphate synthase
MEAACRGGAILGGLGQDQEDALAAFGFGLGIAFQMTDDVIDYRSEKATMGKEPGKDIAEGKLTLPLITALKKSNDMERERVSRIIRDKRVSAEELLWIKALLERQGGIQETLEKSRSYLDDAVRHLALFPDSEEKAALKRLAERILHRTY